MKTLLSTLRSFFVHSTTRQALKFGIVGVLNTAIDFCVYLFLTRLIPFFGDHKIAANTLSFLVAVTNSFFLNKHWTFKDKTKTASSQYSKFFFVSIGGLILNQAFFSLLHTMIGWHDIAAKAFSAVVVMSWNFTVNKFWTFRTRRDH